MAHSFANLLVHVVFSTKNREPLLKPEHRSRLYPYLGGILRGLKATPIAINGIADHVHLLIAVPSTLAVADMLRILKANSSKWLRETFPELSRFAWQTGYAAFSVSQSQRETVKRYIAKQEIHHQAKSFKDEFIEFLQKHGISYDERYIWE